MPSTTAVGVSHDVPFVVETPYVGTHLVKPNGLEEMVLISVTPKVTRVRYETPPVRPAIVAVCVSGIQP